jgi:hypothetical protein
MAGSFSNSLGLQGGYSLAPAPTKSLFAGNYLTFDSVSGGGTFAKQFLPDVYEQEVERYGNRSVSSFLRMVGAELPSTSDQIIWSEQGRLHLAYKNVRVKTVNTATDNVLTFTNTADGIHAIRVGQTIIVSTGSVTVKAYVSAVNGANTEVTAQPYTAAQWPASFVAAGTNPNLSVFVYGSEFAKGTAGMQESVEAGFKQYSNSPIILKDKYSVKGSDTAQIGWVEVTTENGASGYLWYLKSEHETRLRFEDYLEMALVEGELAASGSDALVNSSVKGTEGLFAAITSRGNVFQGFTGQGTGAGSLALTEFDAILKNLDKQGAIEENMLFLNRDMSLNFDNMLASVTVNTVGGTSYGVFENSEDMALNLGFSGFRRGSYDFYKTDWKYLNNASTRGLTNDIMGVLTPAGTSTVYDQSLGKNIKRPFLHVRYRASEADDRRMKSWITGSVGGAYTSDVDEMNVHFLSERCLITQAANNFVLFTV